MKIKVSTLARAIIQDNTTDFPVDTKSFLVRVQLTKCDDYEVFHEAMDKAGFKREIEDLGGRLRRLPDATYFISGESEDTRPQSVHSRVSQVVRKFRHETEQLAITSQILVVAVDGAWFELDEVPDEQE